MARGDRPGGPLTSGAFRIAAAALAAVVIVASVIVGMLFRQAEGALRAEVLASLNGERAAIERVSGAGGSAGVEVLIGQLSLGDPGRIYLFVDAKGVKRAGNIDRVPPEIADKPGGGVFSYQRQAGSADAPRQAVAVVVRLADGARVVLGRDIEAEQAMLSRLRLLALIGMGLLAGIGLAGGYLLSRAILGRLESVNRTARSIMAGDMARRIPLSGQGDEIDAVAGNLNDMLDRIELLMNSLREVSDNIAHDLKTPLNRLRNRAEAALRDTGDPNACRAGLELTIEQADDLIKTFNALLLIARLEAGALEGSLEEVDLGRLVEGVVELYEPVAEEAQMALGYTVAAPVLMQVNAHLVGQAVANLIDNAIKYGRAAAAAGNGGPVPRAATRVDVVVRAAGRGAEIVVGDDGPGIGVEDRERVLKRFVRLEQSRSRPGTGLGLSLVAAVARLHGGSVRLEDNGPGLRVVLHLPVRKDEEAA